MFAPVSEKIYEENKNIFNILNPISTYTTFFQLLVVDENTRLGSQGPSSIKSHPWFEGVDWKGVADSSFPVPHEISSRISQHLESVLQDSALPQASPPRDVEELNAPEWLEDW